MTFRWTAGRIAGHLDHWCDSALPFGRRNFAWTAKKNESEWDLVKGAELYSADPRHADARGAFQAKPDLQHAHLESASLMGSNCGRPDCQGSSSIAQT